MTSVSMPMPTRRDVALARPPPLRHGTATPTRSSSTTRSVGGTCSSSTAAACTSSTRAPPTTWRRRSPGTPPGRRCRGWDSPAIRSSTIGRSSPPPLRAIVARRRPEVQPRLHVLLRAAGRLRHGVAIDVAREAHAAVDLSARRRRAAGDRVTVAFMGGEPLVNRAVVRAATEYARGARRDARRRGALSITTNGTLVTADDVEFFERARFRGHDQHRRRPRHARRAAPVPERAWLLRPHPRPRASRCWRGSTACRCRRGSRSRRTTSPSTRSSTHLLALGFHSVGVSPMLSLAHRARRSRTGGAGGAARSHDRCRPRLRTPHRGRRAVRIRQRRQRDARDRPRHPPPVSMRRRRRLPRRRRRRRAVRLPPLRRRRGRRDGLARHRRRRRPAGDVAGRSARAPPGAVPQLLGALSLRWWLPSRSRASWTPGVRLHPRLARVLHRRLCPAVRQRRRGPGPCGGRPRHRSGDAGRDCGGRVCGRGRPGGERPSGAAGATRPYGVAPWSAPSSPGHASGNRSVPGRSAAARRDRRAERR